MIDLENERKIWGPLITKKGEFTHGKNFTKTKTKIKKDGHTEFGR